MNAYGVYLALRHAKSSPPHLDAPFGLYPVSILKPLKGVDEGLEQNVESFFKLNYPVFELIFSVPSERDPAKGIVERIIRRYPGVHARLVIGDLQIGPNPKVNNLIQSYESARHDIILISDSNVVVSPEYLTRLVAHLDNGVGIVTGVVAGTSAAGLGGMLEAMFLNTFYAKWMYTAAALGSPCVIGKSMLFTKSTMARIGGIRTLARYLAEDYMAGIAVQKLGLKVVLMSDPITQHIGKYSLRDFWNRHLRWGRIRKAQAPLAFFFEPFTGSLVSGLIGAVAISTWPGASFYQAFCGHILIWAFGDLLVAAQLEKRLKLEAPLVWALRELAAIPLWIHIALGNTVMWRGQRLTLQSGGLLETQANSN